jgi:hypothetical protein
VGLAHLIMARKAGTSGDKSGELAQLMTAKKGA